MSEVKEDICNYFNGAPFKLGNVTTRPTHCGFGTDKTIFRNVSIWNKKVQKWQEDVIMEYKTTCPSCKITKMLVRVIPGTSYFGICSKCTEIIYAKHSQPKVKNEK